MLEFAALAIGLFLAMVIIRDATSGSGFSARAGRLHDTDREARQLLADLDAVGTESSVGDASPSEVIPGLYLGSLADAGPDTLRRLGVTAVLNLAAGLPMQNQDFVGIEERLDIAALDTPFYDLGAKFDECFAFIDNNLNAQRRVLVHCYAGVSRSCTIVAMYLVRKYMWSPRRALFFVKSARPVCRPNEGFVAQLLSDYYTLLYSQQAGM